MIALRKRLGFTQHEFAKQIGIGRRTIGRYECGAADIPRTVALACSAFAFGLEAMDEITVLYVRSQAALKEEADLTAAARLKIEHEEYDLFWDSRIPHEVKCRLNSCGIRSLRELQKMTATELLRLNGIGAKSVSAILDAMSLMGRPLNP